MIGFDVPMGDHKPVLLKFKLPVKKNFSSTEPNENVESTKTVDNSGKQEDETKIVKDNRLDLEQNDLNRFKNNSENNNRKSNTRKKNRRKNSLRKKDQIRPLESKTNKNLNNNKNIGNKLIEKNDEKLNLKDNKKRLAPLRTMSIPELMSNSKELIKTKRLLLTDKKNHSTSFDQEKIRPRTIHNEEWYLKTQKLFDYSNDPNDQKYETNILGKLRKDSLNEQYWSSRLTSHHSSSSEEWYREINDKIRKVENNQMFRSVEDLNSADISINHFESNNIVNKILDLQTDIEKINEQNILNEIKNETKSELDNKKDESDCKDNEFNQKVTDLQICPCLEEFNEILDSENKNENENENENENKNENENEKKNENENENKDENNDENNFKNDKVENEKINQILVNEKTELVNENKIKEDNKQLVELNAQADVKTETNHINHTNHTNSINQSFTKESNKKSKKSKRKFPKIAGKRCVLMYLSSPFYLVIIINNYHFNRLITNSSYLMFN